MSTQELADGICGRAGRIAAAEAELPRYWTDGAPTDLANLLLVCARHHTLIHTQGFVLVLHPDRRLDVTTADGTVLLHHPAPPWGDPATLAHGQGVSAETLPPDSIQNRIDLDYIVTVLLQQAA